jgi:hypothetical protein
MHILNNTFEYGDPMQYESGKGERGLKQWAKAASVTAQKVGLDNFLFQTVMRVADRMLLSRASDIVQRQQIKVIDSVSNDSKQQVTKRKKAHYRYYRSCDKVVVLDRRGKESPTTRTTCTVSPNVITHLIKGDKTREVFDIWCEITLPKTKDNIKPQLLRAHPKRDKFGCFFDWVDARFEMTREQGKDSEDDETAASDELYVAPAKLLAFYEDMDGIDCAIVHSVQWSEGKETALGNTRLVSNYWREFQTSGWPAIRTIKVADIYRALYVFERKKCKNPVPPMTTTRNRQKEYVVSVIQPRFTWAEAFYLWAMNEVDPMPDEAATLHDSSDSTKSDDDSSQGSGNR